jgi:hypothetical protein
VSWVDPYGLARCQNDPYAEERKAAEAAGWKKPDGSVWWPPNRGFQGDPVATELQPGQQLDRYGSERGTFMATAGTPYTDRALAPGTDKIAPLNNYEVAKAITVKAGPAIPWFGEQGLGTQFETEKSVGELVATGCLLRK